MTGYWMYEAVQAEVDYRTDAIRRAYGRATVENPRRPFWSRRRAAVTVPRQRRAHHDTLVSVGDGVPR